MMEKDQEQRYVCKFCNKICFSGKSLGGHMRGHLALIAAQKDEEVGDQSSYGLRENPKKVLRISEPPDYTLKQEKFKNRVMGLEDCEKASYGLRENPRKSWRVSDSKHGNLNHCKNCGKGFDSMKALFGHMRSHSKRSKVLDESVESQLDLETVCPIRKKRSRTRYKIIQNPFSSSTSNEIDDEVEDLEVATCLMLLSKGTESSDQSMQITRNEKPIEKLDTCVSDSANALFEKNISEFADFDLGFASHNENKMKLEVSVDKILRDDDSFIIAEEEGESAIEEMKQEIPENHNIFHLNLPVSLQEGAKDDVVSKPWWVGNDHEQEAMLISN